MDKVGRTRDDGLREIWPRAPDDRPLSLGALLAEQILSGAAPEQARGFFFAAGRRLGLARPLPPEADCDEMAQAMNRVWRALDLGEVSLELQIDGIEADHRFGRPLADVPGGPPATAAFLEGCYDAWFHAIGGGDRLQTRLLTATDDRISIRYGL